MKEKIHDYKEKLKHQIDAICEKQIEEVINILYDAWRSDKTVFVFGNGGSAATASHFACDLGKNTLKKFYKQTTKRFRIISLNDSMPTILAYSNDLSFDDIFSEQLKNLVLPGDIVIGITGSGNSLNILKAFKVAEENHAVTIGILGFGGGKAKELVDHAIVLNEQEYGIVEDGHWFLCHIIPQILKEKIHEEK